jgi:hypothetical protein
MTKTVYAIVVEIYSTVVDENNNSVLAARPAPPIKRFIYEPLDESLVSQVEAAMASAAGRLIPLDIPLPLTKLARKQLDNLPSCKP